MHSVQRIAVLIVILSMSFAASAGEKPESLAAEEMMILAHKNRSEWDDFPGFQAKVVVSKDNLTLEGQVAVDEGGNVDWLIEGDHDLKWADRKLRSIVSHRMPSGGRKYDVSFGDKITTHPLGRLIKFNRDRFHSIYRVKGDVITEVHRTMGETRFTISVLDVYRNPKGKYLPRAYTVSYWNAKSGDLKTSDMVFLDWKRVGKLDLPTRVLTVRSTGGGKREVEEIRLSDHKLTVASE